MACIRQAVARDVLVVNEPFRHDHDITTARVQERKANAKRRESKEVEERKQPISH